MFGAVYDPSQFMNTNDNGFISVIIQYRLGAFGFLSSDDVKRNGQLNAGLLDQRFALQWVQDHIEKFGGDPAKVTLAGESAGASSVMLQAMAYGGKQNVNLFHNVRVYQICNEYTVNSPSSYWRQVYTLTNSTSTMTRSLSKSIGPLYKLLAVETARMPPALPCSNVWSTRILLFFRMPVVLCRNLAISGLSPSSQSQMASSFNLRHRSRFPMGP